ncbi:PREDICTED: uncharacterized protein LOC107071195 [Polistes dominula]|uniref:Uncharacterized protein LOC107071195 n=1 Tax=Polistes dominula TaxID=743375 RepID=A0ABM1IZ31_POLDO|nr:PREDICTED: uncharacterized protein LOC107071195 [Polistes dominula]
MKYSLVYCLLLCLLLTRVQTKPQITKLFPIEEILTNDHRENNNNNNNETRLFDKLLGKLRSTYNFVFHKTDDNAANNKTEVKNMGIDKTPNSNVFNWNNPNFKLTKEIENPKEEPVYQTRIETLYDAPKNDKFDELQPLESLEPLMPLDFNEDINKNDEVEFVTPATDSNFSATLSRHFVDWLGSLLGISYGIYSKFSKAIYQNNTLY